LADMARLEWLIHRATRMPEQDVPTTSTILRAARANPRRQTVGLFTSIKWIKSRYPVDVIWSAVLRPARPTRGRPVRNKKFRRLRQSVFIEVLRSRGQVIVRRIDDANDGTRFLTTCQRAACPGQLLAIPFGSSRHRRRHRR
jgi:hypothetical protein